MTMYFEKRFKTIEYDGINHILIATWNIPPTSAEYKEGMMAMINAIKFFKTGKLLYNLNHLGVILPENQKWTSGEWRSMAIEAGHSKVAFVMPDDIFTQITTRQMMEIAEDNVAYSYFTKMEDALCWITSETLNVQHHEALNNVSNRKPN